ncbi:MAG TPA: ATP-binding protein [Candidatus Dormibacteraeota bacterium]|nr:ATP-binding protein [Candidatus Dormibacteraeota bacterium]
MRRSLARVPIKSPSDVLSARQWILTASGELGFDSFDQVQLATGVSELAREIVKSGGGDLDVWISGSRPHRLVISVMTSPTDWPGRPSDGLVSARRLLGPPIDDDQGSAAHTFSRLLPASPNRTTVSHPKLANRVDPHEELKGRDTELVGLLEQLRARDDELAMVRRELEETNRGVLALYAELDEKAEAVRRGSEERARFLSDVTHELRTPLSSIVALSRLLITSNKAPLSDEQAQQIRYIQKSAQDLIDFVSDLLDLAKVGAGKTAVRTGSFDVENVFAALRGVFRPLTADSSVRLVFDPGAVPAMESDEHKVSQILRNVVSNAVKFTERGEIRVSACHDRERDEIVMTVTDTGVGIAAEDLDRIFDEFVQVDTRRRARVRGSGLGLPLSRRLAELLGGSLTVESHLGVGSKFTLRLPRVYSEMPQPAPVASTDYVMVVDDDQISRYVAREKLERHGWRVVEATDGEMALKLAREGGCRAIVTDIAMPGMNGFELIERLEGDPATAGIPIVVRTSLPLDEVRSTLRRSAAVFSKDDDRIESVVERVRGSIRSRR